MAWTNFSVAEKDPVPRRSPIDLGTPEQDQENIPPTSAQRPSNLHKGKGLRRSYSHQLGSSSTETSSDDTPRRRGKDSIPAYEMRMFNAVVNRFSVMALNVGILDNDLKQTTQLKELWRKVALEIRHVGEDGEPLQPSPQVIQVVSYFMHAFYVHLGAPRSG